MRAPDALVLLLAVLLLLLTCVLGTLAPDSQKPKGKPKESSQLQAEVRGLRTADATTAWRT